MPPPLVEEGDSSADEIPHKDQPANGADESDDNDSDGDDAPDEYVVEKILKHDWLDDGTLTFEVKWLGYESESDRTWEPEENLETASDVLKAYFKKIGGRPARSAGKAKKSKKRAAEQAAATPAPKRGRKNGKLSSTPEVATTTAVPASTRKGKKDSDVDMDVNNWKPPAGSWEDEVAAIDTIEENWDPEAGKNIRQAYIVWSNGRKTRHLLTTLNDKCPQKMLSYYESHLSFRQSDAEPEAKKEAANNPIAKRAKTEK